MTDHPILIHPALAPLVRNGRKTQHRAVMKQQPIRQHNIQWLDDGWGGAWRVLTHWASIVETIKCPYAVGDYIRWLTTWAVEGIYDQYSAKVLTPRVRFWDASYGRKPLWAGKSRPGQQCPKHLRHNFPRSRIVEIRAQQLQEISHGDIEAEGIPIHKDHPTGPTELNRAWHYQAFMDRWDRTCKPNHPWGSNPWVWALTFEEATCPTH